MRAEEQLGLLAAVNRGFAGGEGYAALHKALLSTLEHQP